jgi:chromosome segregation ATPase
LGEEYKRDKIEIEEKRKLFLSEQKQQENQFEAKLLVAKNEMLDAKLEMEKNFQSKLEAHRKRYQLQLTEVRKEEKQKVASETNLYTQQLEKCEKENKEFTNKINDANDILRHLKSNIALLKRDIRREILNDEVVGTSKIAELKNSSISAAEKKDCALLEKKISSQKQKINDCAAEISLVREQVSILESKIQQVQQEKTLREMAYSQMEQSKQEMEDRLSEQIEALDAKIHRSDHNQAEYDTEIEKLEEVLSFITSEAQGLREQVVSLTTEYKNSQKITSSLADDLTKLLNEERLKILKMEKDKRAIEATYQNLEKKNTSILDREANLKVQLKNFTKSYRQNSEATELAQGKNQKLEQAVRKLESRASK